jgi:ribulose-5-phosphate 4-epimerase/fuculose-1-phosphate aldolase
VVLYLGVYMKSRVQFGREARVDLAACYRLVDLYGMADLIYGHITARSGSHFLINPFGMLFSEIKASDLISVSSDGTVVANPTHELGYCVNAAGFMMHSAIHEARPEINCVIHTHTRASTAVSAMECGLLPLSQQAMRFHGRLGYHKYEGPTYDEDTKERLVCDLGVHDAMMLRNHGLLVCGRTVAEAFNLLYWLENACRIQVDMLSCNRPLVMPSDDGLAKIQAVFDRAEITLSNNHELNPNVAPAVKKSAAGYGSLEWRALLRKLDSIDPSYAE